LPGFSSPRRAGRIVAGRVDCPASPRPAVRGASSPGVLIARLLLAPPCGAHRRRAVSILRPVTWTAVHPDRQADIAALDTTLTTVERVLDIDGLRSRIEKLEHEASDPKLWDDQTRAQRVTSELSHTQNELRRVEELRQRLDDLPVLYQLAEEEDAEDAKAEADVELKNLHTDIEAMEVRTLLSGEYDQREALLTIRSGAGGVDAADWAEMLMRMYIRWAEQHKYTVEVFDTSYAEEAGIKSATFTVHAPYGYGTLSVEQGTHRLVRISPFDNQNRRQTSFAEVEVLPVVETTDHIDIPEGDLRVDVYRSSGPGGQSVNTTDSAVRLTHVPTGIVVTCQNEKSQLQNKVAAMRVLQAKLLERKRLEERAELDALKGDGGSSWGNQMRSYVLHPYQMVKDLRTDYEVGNPAAVLDGDIDGFLEAGIRWRNRKDDDD
jgi:peptide chain release factor 2